MGPPPPPPPPTPKKTLPQPTGLFDPTLLPLPIDPTVVALIKTLEGIHDFGVAISEFKDKPDPDAFIDCIT